MAHFVCVMGRRTPKLRLMQMRNRWRWTLQGLGVVALVIGSVLLFQPVTGLECLPHSVLADSWSDSIGKLLPACIREAVREPRSCV